MILGRELKKNNVFGKYALQWSMLSVTYMTYNSLDCFPLNLVHIYSDIIIYVVADL